MFSAPEEEPVTIGIAIKCTDGMVVGCDSLATFSRGAPVLRHTNKIHVLDHPGLEFPVAVLGAGMITFIDKFLDRATRGQIEAAKKKLGKKLDIIDFSDLVCEVIVPILFKEYMIDRNRFFGSPISDFSLSMIVAGGTKGGETRAYLVHSTGLTERVEEYGTIGSGAAYAELFLRGLIPDPNDITTEDASRLAVYAIKGVELMDPHVGGKSGVHVLTVDEKGKLKIRAMSKAKMPSDARSQMESVVKKIGEDMRALLATEVKKK